MVYIDLSRLRWTMSNYRSLCFLLGPSRILSIYRQFVHFFRACRWLAAVPQGARIRAPEEPDELELIHRSQAGDTEAFGELVTKYRAKILARLDSIVHNENDAQDLSQEGFLKAWQSICRFEGRSSFYTWLHSITVNLAIEALRKRRLYVEVELDPMIPSSVPSPRFNYQRNEIRQHINEALAQLSPEHRAVVVLKVIEDLKYQEIARTLNVSIGTVMSRLFYARKRLQSILGPHYNHIRKKRSERNTENRVEKSE
jgi:RNA polymerase sigma-70 factor, ECF subfamily